MKARLYIENISLIGLAAQHSLLSFCLLMGTASSRSPNKQRLRYIHNKKNRPPRSVKPCEGDDK